jgi:hypothetical protein
VALASVSVLPGKSPLRMVAGLTWSIDSPVERHLRSFSQ